MPDFSPAQPRRAETRRSAGKAACLPEHRQSASEEARRTLRYVEPLSETRTPLADFFSILLESFTEAEALWRPFLSSTTKSSSAN